MSLREPVAQHFVNGLIAVFAPDLLPCQQLAAVHVPPQEIVGPANAVHCPECLIGEDQAIPISPREMPAANLLQEGVEALYVVVLRPHGICLS